MNFHGNTEWWEQSTKQDKTDELGITESEEPSEIKKHKSLGTSIRGIKATTYANDAIADVSLLPKKHYRKAQQWK